MAKRKRADDGKGSAQSTRGSSSADWTGWGDGKYKGSNGTSKGPSGARPDRQLAQPPARPAVVLAEHVAAFMGEVCKIAGHNEVGGMGYVSFDPETREFYVDEVFLVPQEVSGGHVTITGEAVAYGMEKAFADGRLEDLRFSWHSHNNMQVFWSNTDEGGINSYLRGGAPWLLSIVTNNDAHMLARLDTVQSAPLGRACFDRLIVEVESSDPTNGEAWRQFAEHVSVWTPPVRKHPVGFRPKPSEDKDGDASKSQEIGDKLDAALAIIGDAGEDDPRGLTPREREALNAAGFSDKQIDEMTEDALLDCIIALAHAEEAGSGEGKSFEEALVEAGFTIVEADGSPVEPPEGHEDVLTGEVVA
jgi:hypothetical protein